MKNASPDDLKEFLGKKTSEQAAQEAAAQAGEQAAEQAASQAAGSPLDTINQNLQGGNNTLNQINSIVENIAKISDNLGSFISPKSQERKAGANSYPDDQQTDAFGQPLPPDVSEQAKHDYAQFARRRQEEKDEQHSKPPQRPPARRKPDGGGEDNPKDEPDAEAPVSNSEQSAQMSDEEKARLTYAFFGEVLRGIEQTDPEAKITKIREEYRNGKGRIIKQLKKQIVSL